MTKWMLLAALAAVSISAVGRAAQYFVSPTGNNSAAGTSSAPWLTLQHAADAVHLGDRVTVRAGNYVGFDLTTSGTATAPIEFDADPGVNVTQRNAATPDGINLENASHIIIDGFNVNGMPRAGVRSVGADGTHLASFVTVRNVHTTNNGTWGIFTGFVNDLLIENNVASGSIEQHGIYVSNSGDRPVIRNNILFDNHGSGIHMNGDLSQGGDGIISGAIVSGNRIYNNAMPNTTYPVLGGGSGINMDGVQNSRIENNLVYNNHASGISLYRIDAAAGSSGNVVVNNTVYQPIDGRWALNIQNGSTGNAALNNILISDHASRGAIDISDNSLSGFTSDYNAVISRFTTNGGSSVLSLSQWQTATGEDAHSLIGNAGTLFANPGSGDYHLLGTAPARNAGTSLLAPPADFDGLLRPAGAAFDIGAFEFGAIAGDYNRDGLVNAADYVLWRKTLGSSVTRFAGADGDGSGVIDQADYLRWRANFGTTAAAGMASALGVPEPPTIVMIWIAFAAIRLSKARLCRIQLR